MKLYVCHSTNFDYQSELYEPLRQEFGEAHQLVLPHDNKDGEHSKAIIASSDMVLAEVSYPSTGQGIELGWADDLNIPIVCLYKSTETPSGALRHVAREIIAYDATGDMIVKMTRALQASLF